MTIVEALRTRLLEIADLTMLVSSRIYALNWPENPVMPSMRLQVISEIETMHLRGSDGVARTRIQVDAGANEYDGDPYGMAHAVSDLAHGGFVTIPTGLDGYVGEPGGSPGIYILSVFPADKREFYDAEDERRQVIVSRDYFVTYRLT